MNRDRYARITELFQQAADLDPAGREALLDLACEGDSELRRGVEQLLAHDDTDPAGDLRTGHDRLDRACGLLAEAVLESVPSPTIPERIGHYRILKRIGEGGMGVVYLAEQDHPRRRVALKMIRVDTVSRNLLKRFRFEAEVLGRLRHPGIAQIHEAGEIDTASGSLPFFAMEYVEGTELRRYAREHDLGTRDKLEIVARIADAVHHAHLKGIVHRDLKPDNVLVVDETAVTTPGEPAEFARLGQPKVLDFGVARATDADLQLTTAHTGTGQLVGTITYMSPEQVGGDPGQLDVRSDIYALGVLLYELLAGRPPFDLRHVSIPEAARTICEKEPTRLASIDTAFRGEIDAIACKALEKNCERRYDSASDFASDLRRHLSNEPILAHPPSAFYEIRRFARRHKGLVAGLLVACLILVAGTVISVAFGISAARSETRALAGEDATLRANFRLNVNAAQALGDASPLQALEHLRSVPILHRGWEWHHMQSCLVSHVVTSTEGIALTCRAPTLARNSEGETVVVLERDGTAALVNAVTGTVERTFPCAKGAEMMGISADGTRVVLRRDDRKSIEVWDIPGRTHLLTLPVDASDEQPFCRLSTDGSHLAMRVSNEFKLVHIPSGRRVPVPGNLSGGIHESVFDHRGERFVCVKYPEILFHSVAGELLGVAPMTGLIVSAAFSPDGSCLATGHSQRLITLYDAGTHERLATLHGHSSGVHSVAFSPDSRTLASASTDGTVRLWDRRDGSVLRVLSTPGFATNKASLAFSPDGRTLTLAAQEGLRVWELQQDRARRTIDTPDAYLYHLAFSPDGNRIASASFSGNVRLFDVWSGQSLVSCKAALSRYGVGFTPDGSRLLAISNRSSDSPCHYLVCDTAALLPVAAPRNGRDDILFGKRSTDMGNRSTDMTQVAIGLLAACRGGATSMSEVDVGSSLTSNRDASLVAAIIPDGEIRIIEIKSGSIVKRFDVPPGRYVSVAFSPCGGRLVAGDINGTITVWDYESGEKLAGMRGHQGKVYCVTFSPGGARIASGGNDANVVLWDAESFERVAVFSEHASYVHAVAFSPDGTLLASAGGDGTIRILDSVLPRERREQDLREEELRRDAEPIVAALLAETEDLLEVADRIRGDEALGEALRGAALRVLAAKTMDR